MKKTLSVIMACLFLISMVGIGYAETNNGILQFNADGKFTILHLTDSQDDRYPSHDMLNLVKRAINETNPDLIVFTGDIVEDWRIGDICVDEAPLIEGVCKKNIKGDILFDETLDNINAAVDALFSVFEASGVPYIVTQGNNDGKCGISNSDWLEIYSRYPNCLVTDMSNDSLNRIDSNLLIYGSNNSPVFNLWLMDTAGGGVCDEQISWYKSRCEEIKSQNGGLAIPSLVFQHINVSEIGNLFEQCKPWDEGARPLDGKFYRLNKSIASGDSFYAYKPGQNSEQFAAWEECGDVLGAFFGHQHVEGFSGYYHGIELGFTYGCQFAKTAPYGFRVITLDESDVYNYFNELYTYSGKVKFGTDKIEKTESKTYAQADNFLTDFILKIKNIFDLFSVLITRLFS